MQKKVLFLCLLPFSIVQKMFGKLPVLVYHLWGNHQICMQKL